MKNAMHINNAWVTFMMSSKFATKDPMIEMKVLNNENKIIAADHPIYSTASLGWSLFGYTPIQRRNLLVKVKTVISTLNDVMFSCRLHN